MGEYDSAVALAKRLLTKKGQAVTLRSVTPAAGADPDQPWRPGPSTTADQTVRAVFLDYARQYIDGTQVMEGDQRALMPATDASGDAIEPTADKLLLRGSEVWRIVRTKPLNPGGQVIMYECQVRR